MKREKRNKIFSLLILLVFAITHLPVNLLHPHDHPPACSVIAKNIKNSGEAHYHEREHEQCFICSANLKKDCGVIIAQHFNFCSVSFKNYLLDNHSFYALSQGINQSRAPPFILS